MTNLLLQSLRAQTHWNGTLYSITQSTPGKNFKHWDIRHDTDQYGHIRVISYDPDFGEALLIFDQ